MPEPPSVLFDPDDRSVTSHLKFGVWDWYQDISGTKGRLIKLPSFLTKWKPLVDSISQGKPYIVRMINDIASIPGCMLYFVIFLALSLVSSLLPAISFWYSSEFLKMIETAIDQRTIDTIALAYIAAGRICVPLVERVINDTTGYLQRKLRKHIEMFYGMRVFELTLKLDVPTFNDAGTKVQLDSFMQDRYSELIWSGFTMVLGAFSQVITTASQFTVLINVLRQHQDARFLLVSTAFRTSMDLINSPSDRLIGAYAYKTENDDYTSLQGLKSMSRDALCRKDIVAGGLWDYLSQQFRRRELALGETPTDIWTLPIFGFHQTWLTWALSYTQDPIDALMQISTCLRVVHSPATAPFSLASLQLINSTIASVCWDLHSFGQLSDMISGNLDQVRKFYEFLDLPNKIESGLISFPENQLDLSQGISVEFKNVSFKYTAAAEKLVLKNVSFKIHQGQLCVVVGENGSGKSTILNLITRIYDITEGQILLNGLDLRTLRLDDVRKAIAVLFQEYAIFPLTLADNIGLGDPVHAEDLDKIHQAAKLGGAEEFIEGLPHKFGTFVSPIQNDYGHPIPSKDSAFAGKKFDFAKLKLNERNTDLSGGQKQRIALSRIFMKSLVSPDSRVGLLLFDEPSASLDPKAEHELFTRLRELRGNKTMVFSSHRFGKLTRHADLILYVQKGEILEAGNHVELMKKDGEYAKFWNLQAQDFL